MFLLFPFHVDELSAVIFIIQVHDVGDKEFRKCSQFGFQVVHEAIAFLGDGIGPVVGKKNRGTDWWYEIMQVGAHTNHHQYHQLPISIRGRAHIT